MTDIETLIDEAALWEHPDVRPRDGSCIEIAVALRERCGGSLVGISQRANDAIPSHLLVEQNGTYYDGRGETTLNAMYEMFVPPSEQAGLDNHTFEPIHVRDYMEFSDFQYDIVAEELDSALERLNE